MSFLPKHCWLAFGPHLIEAYQAISRNSIVIICERCLEQFPTDQHLWQHQEHCDILTPPGHGTLAPIANFAGQDPGLARFDSLFCFSFLVFWTLRKLSCLSSFSLVPTLSSVVLRSVSFSLPVVSQGNSCRVWQVDGAENPEYAVRLARLGRFFICNKIPQLQPDAFDFFVLTRELHTSPEIISFVACRISALLIKMAFFPSSLPLCRKSQLPRRAASHCWLFFQRKGLY